MVKLKSCLEKLESQKLRAIAKEWDCDPGGDVTSNYCKRELLEYLINRKGFEKALDGFCEKGKIEQEEREYLIYKALGMEVNNCRVHKKLERYGILYEDIIPSEFQETIIEYVRRNRLGIPQDISIEVKPSPFLKLLLTFNHLRRRGYNIQDVNERVDWESGIIKRKHIIDYLQIRKLIDIKEKRKQLNAEKLQSWIQAERKSMQDFYQYVFIQLKMEGICKFFDVFIRLVNNDQQWIKINEMKYIEECFKNEIDKAIELGLVSKVINSDDEYIQLTPEACYLTTGKQPIHWEQKEILLTPIGEVFIPYNFNPFVIRVIDYHGYRKGDKKKEREKYNNDYFIVADISKYSKFNSKQVRAENLKQYILKYTDNIPDVIQYDVLNNI